MSKKSFTIFIIILIALLAFLGWFFFLRTDTPSSPNGTNNGQNPFPFGQGGNSSTTNPTQNNNGQTGIDIPTIDLGGDFGTELPKLRQISMVPTAGAVTYNLGTKTLVRYMERATGHIYETSSDSTEVTKISNVTLPKIHEAIWNKDGKKLVIRYIKDDSSVIRTFSAKISTTSTETALEGSFLPDDIDNISVQGDKIFYLSKVSSGEQGITANIDGSKKTAVFNSSFSDWASVWSSPVTITLFARPSGLVSSGAYILNSTTGEYSKVIDDVFGTTALSNTDGSLVIYSGSSDRSLVTGIITVKDNSSKNAGFSTLTDKCIWSTKQKNIIFCAVPNIITPATYPDDWYKGKVSFDDSLWKIDAITGETTQLVNPQLVVGTPIDMIDLKIDTNETGILFTNKKDMTVWRYTLGE